MKTKIGIKKMVLVGFGIALNIVGAFIALNLRLPIYMDSIGTIMIAYLLGPKYAVLTGLSGSIVSGISFDIYSLYFAPVQISTGLISGWVFQTNLIKGRKIPLGVLLFALPTSFVSAVISAAVFGGITSSGSSYIVQVLSAINVPTVVSVFIVQVITDYIDKYIAVLLVIATAKLLPHSMKTHNSPKIDDKNS